MSYELKCIENKEMAMLCYEKKKYNSFVNRYYYSVYQALLDKLKSTDEDLLKDINALEGGSHEKTIYLFIEKIAKVKTSKKGINKLKEVSMIRSLFYNMKLARKKADYSEDDISKKEADGVMRNYDNFISYLNNY